MTDSRSIDPARLAAIAEFVQGAAKLKDTIRSGFTCAGRTESTAEHTWRFSLLALMIGAEIPECDTLHLVKLAIVHDLGEAIAGDIPAIHQTPDSNKNDEEREGLITLCAPLPDDLRDEMLSLYDEYNAAETLEAILAKGLDKLETIFQQAIGGNPPDFDYAFNLDYGSQHTARHPLLRELRQLADAATRARMPDSHK